MKKNLWVKSILVVAVLFLLFTTLGCESFRRKFIRKRKTPEKKEEVVVAFENYPDAPFPKDIVYKNYLLYWRSWVDELVTALGSGGSRKKRIDCAEQAIGNLVSMQQMLIEEKRPGLNPYIDELKDIKIKATSDVINEVLSNRLSARLRNHKIVVERDFGYQKAKDFLK